MFWTLVSIAIGLVGVFCASKARRFPDRHEAAYYWCLAVVCLPAALAVGLRQSLEPAAVASLMVLVAAFYWAHSYYGHSRLAASWRLPLAVVAGLLPLLGAYLAKDAPVPFVLCLLAAALINAELSLRFIQAWFALIALFAVLLVPAFVGQGITTPALSAAGQAWAYVVLAGFLVLWRVRLGGQGESFEAVGITGYLLATLTSLGYALVSGPSTTFAVGLTLAAGVYRVSRPEPLPEAFTYVSVAIAACAFIQLSDIYSWPIAMNALILATYGSLLYLAGRHSESPRRAGPLRYSGLILAFLGVYPGLLTQIPPLEPVIALATGGALLWFEARWQRSVIAYELSGAVMILAFDWLLRHELVTQLQWYTLPAAAYFTLLAFRRRDLPREAYDVFAIAALMFLTVPLALQAFVLQSQYYGLTLIGEALGLVIVGPALGYRLVTTWGMVTYSAAVLYYVPYLINAVLELFPS